MNDSILQTIKQLLGISEADESFDPNIIILVNSVLNILSQIGLEEANNFQIKGSSETWNELFRDRKDLEIVKTYICFKVKMMFDPPTSSAALEATKRVLDEQEWRIANIYVNKEEVPEWTSRMKLKIFFFFSAI